MPRQGGRRSPSRRAALCLEPLEPRLLLASITGIALPTAWDQFLLELINRGRADPAAEAARYGVALNEGVPAGDTISTDSKQPLAMNPNVLDAAREHTQWMIDTEIFSHTGAAGSDPGDRMAAAGYSFVLPWSWGENIALYRETPTVPEPTWATEYLHEILFVDEDYPGRGHRVNLMDPGFREVGAAVASGEWDGYNAIACTEDFASTGTSVFITGVAYNDDAQLDDDFYTPGEGLGGVAIVATRLSDSAEFPAATWASGGYSLEVPDGTYDVTATGGGLGGTVLYTSVVVSGQNVKLDFTPDLVIPAAELTVTDDQGAAADHEVDFGGIPVVAGSQAHDVVLTNTGQEDLTITSIVRSDTANYAVVWDGDGSPPATLAPAASRTATLTFDPTAAGTLDATFTIESDGGTVVVDLLGVGLAPEVAATDSQGAADDLAIDFGALATPAGQQAYTVTLANTGNQALTLAGITLSDAANYTLTWDGDGSAPATIGPGAARVATLTFDPFSIGTHDATLTIESDDADEPTVVVDLTGEGLSDPDPFEPNETWDAAYDFGAAPVVQADGLTLDDPSDVDWFTFTMGSPGPASSRVELTFVHAGGNIDVRLYADPQGVPILTGNSLTDNELLSLDGLGAGTYYIEVLAAGGAANTYDLVVQTAEMEYVGWLPGGGQSRVYVYDCSGTADVALADIRVKAGKGDSIASITLGGVQAMEGVGLVVSGATAVGSIKDARKGPLGAVAFIAVDAPAKSVKLKGELAGFNLNGLELPGHTFAADLDADGDLADGTGLWVSGELKKATFGADVEADAVFGGNVLKITGKGAMTGDLVAAGYAKKLSFVGDWTGTTRALWIGKASTKGSWTGVLEATGADAKGVSIASLSAGRVPDATLIGPGGAKKITVQEWLAGTIDVGWLGSLAVKGNRKVAGVDGDLGADLTAVFAKSISAKGDLDGAAITLTQGVDPDVRALAKLKVVGWIRDSVVACSGHVGSVAVGGMDGSTFFAGVAGAELPDEAADFAGDCVVKKFAVNGIKAGKLFVDSFIDSGVAAWQIVKASVREVVTDNGGETFGFAATDIGSLTWRQGAERFRWPEKKPEDWPDDTVDFVALEVV